MVEKKYIHHVSYMAAGNISGVSTVLNNLSEYKSKTEIDDLQLFISENNGIKSPIVTNILTFKND